MGEDELPRSAHAIGKTNHLCLLCNQQFSRNVKIFLPSSDYERLRSVKGNQEVVPPISALNKGAACTEIWSGQTKKFKIGYRDFTLQWSLQ